MVSSKHICIVDDDMDDIFLMSSSLRRIEASADFALTITTFTDGKAALKFLSDLTLTSGVLPDCICLDVNMPGIDGIELLIRLRKMDQLKLLPIYIISTTVDQYTHSKAIASGATGSFVKPESMSATQNMQRQFLGLD